MPVLYMSALSSGGVASKAVSYTHLIKGDMGVYVVSMTSLTPSAELTDVETERKTLEQRMQGRAEGTLCLLYTSRCV